MCFDAKQPSPGGAPQLMGMAGAPAKTPLPLEQQNKSRTVVEGLDDKPPTNSGPNRSVVPLVPMLPNGKLPESNRTNLTPEYLLGHENHFDKNVTTPEDMAKKKFGVPMVKRT